MYYSIEMRVGKTLIALATAELAGAARVLFVTKKKAIESVELDFQREPFTFTLDVTNYEQVSKFGGKQHYDVIIVDEAHGLGAFPKPSLRTEQLKELAKRSQIIYLSGTPTPETYSQIFHQLWISPFSPFEHKNFYKWAKEYVDIRERVINGYKMNDYTKARKDLIDEKTKHLFVSYTQSEAGFTAGEVQESILLVPMDERIYKLSKLLVANKYHKFLDGSELVCDSAVKLQNKLHQIFSGTIITETGEPKILDRSKAKFIKRFFEGKKIAVFYQFQAEGTMLREELENITDSPSEFNVSTDKTFLCQIQSGSMGINLATADALVFMNINFSFVQYWQARARAQALEREDSAKVYWIFSENGIEQKILEAVTKKKNYTLSYFNRDYGIGHSSTNPRLAQRAGHLRREDGHRQPLRSA